MQHVIAGVESDFLRATGPVAGFRCQTPASARAYSPRRLNEDLEPSRIRCAAVGGHARVRDAAAGVVAAAVAADFGAVEKIHDIAVDGAHHSLVRPAEVDRGRVVGSVFKLHAKRTT